MKMSRILTVGLLLVASLTARAATVYIDINTFVSGTNNGNVLVAKLKIEDFAANVVKITLDSVWSPALFGSNAKLTSLYLETSQPTKHDSGAYISGNPIDKFDFDLNKSNAGFTYDTEVEYPTSTNKDPLLLGDQSVFTLTDSGLDAWDFTKAMVHIQSLGDGSSTKYAGYEAVPEPGTMIALGMGIAAAVRRRKKA